MFAMRCGRVGNRHFFRQHFHNHNLYGARKCAVGLRGERLIFPRRVVIRPVVMVSLAIIVSPSGERKKPWHRRPGFF